MKIQLLSDLHSECYKHLKFRKFVDALDPSGVDVLLLAGDIGNSTTFPDAIHAICEKYKDSKVLHTAGNHEHWRASPYEAIESARSLEKELKNYHFLNNELIEIKGQRFLGGTMWFRETEETNYLGRDWSDFHEIKDGKAWIYQNNREFLEFMEKNLKKDDVVMTHHLPSYQCVNEKFKGDRSNCFFVCPMDTLIVEREPALWCYGHSHTSADIILGKTRVVNNPMGYHDWSINDEFNKKLVIDV